MADSQYRRADLSTIMITDAVRIGMRMPHIHALIELDVTKARQQLRELRKQTSEKRSFTAFILFACIRAVGEDKSIQGMRNFRGGCRMYNDVDVFFPLENESGTAKRLHSILIRNAQTLGISDFDDCLKSALKEVIPKSDWMQRLFLQAPWIFKKWFYLVWIGIPRWRKKYFGTVYFSSTLNYSIDRPLWGIPLPMHSLGIFIGGTSKRVVKNNTGFENRDMLQITVTVDHRVNNGGDLGRFIHRLKDKLEKGVLDPPAS